MDLPDAGIDLNAHLHMIEEGLIRQALERTDWSTTHAASLLRLGRTTLYERMIKLGIRDRKRRNAIKDRMIERITKDDPKPTP